MSLTFVTNRSMLETRKIVLDWGSMSDRPRYCVTTPTRAGHWPLTVTCYPDFQPQASYGHDPQTQTHTCFIKYQSINQSHTIKNSSSKSVQKIEWKQMDRRTDRRTLPIALPSRLTKSVKIIIRPKLCFASGELLKYYTGQKKAFTLSVITPPNVNRFGWNVEHCEHIAGGWPWQILGAIRTVATVWQAGEILFVFCQVNIARFRRFPVG